MLAGSPDSVQSFLDDELLPAQVSLREFLLEPPGTIARVLRTGEGLLLLDDGEVVRHWRTSTGGSEEIPETTRSSRRSSDSRPWLASPRVQDRFGTVPVCDTMPQPNQGPP